MKLSDIMSAADLTIYPRVALILFLFAFLVVVVRLLLSGSPTTWAHDAALPLDDVNDRFADSSRKDGSL
jgi:hypothetical protein